MAKVLYTQKGSDPATITWPNAGCAADKFTFANGVTTQTPLIGHGDGSLEYPDGRAFPAVTPGGSSLTHSK